MPAYHYKAVNRAGADEKGVIEAESERDARQLLRERSLLPVHLKAAKGKSSTTKSAFYWLRPRGLSAKDLALVTRQMATLLLAGLPVEEVLRAVSEQTEKTHAKALMLSVRGKVVEGHALHQALSEHPEAFSALFCATVAAGEKSGHLDKVLMRLADYTEQQWHMQQKLKTALIYPAMIVMVAVGIVGFLLEYVVPKMVAVYSKQSQALPGLTQTLISISTVVKDYGLVFVVGLIFICISVRWLLKRNENFRLYFHKLLLKLPLVGNASKTANTARFSRTLAILSSSGVPVLEAMTISTQLITSLPIKNAVKQAVARVREGAAIHLALKHTTFFSPMCVHMVASGEASGQLEGMLERTAKTQEDDIVRLIDVSLALFEPAIILIMGAIVLFIVLAVLLPIFQLDQFT